MELPGHPFFMGKLFVPQARATTHGLRSSIGPRGGALAVSELLKRRASFWRKPRRARRWNMHLPGWGKLQLARSFKSPAGVCKLLQRNGGRDEIRRSSEANA